MLLSCRCRIYLLVISGLLATPSYMRDPGDPYFKEVILKALVLRKISLDDDSYIRIGLAHIERIRVPFTGG
jgi:hypothetical protein